VTTDTASRVARQRDYHTAAELHIAHLVVTPGEWRSPAARPIRLGQWLQANILVANLFRYRPKNPAGQCRTTPAVSAVYETTDTAAVSVASSLTLLS